MVVKTMLKIEEVEVQDELPCIVCGKMCKHRHYFNTEPLKRIAVCPDCCLRGAGGKHNVVDLRAKEYYCKACDKTLAADKVGQISDDVFICPDCNNKVERKS